ncbi:MAG: NAD-dependent epimerase/dehydratase family protein, partial [Actinomycetota bacterium]
MNGIVLVTGGAGFIGSHVVDTLIDEGTTVRVLDILLDAAHHGRPDYLSPGAEYVFGDLRDATLVERCLEGVTAVSHQASMVGLGTDLGDVARYVDHNDAGTAALLLALHRRGFAGRIVLGSSMVVYGEGAYRCREHGAVRPPPRTPERLATGAFEPPCPVCGSDLIAESIREEAPTDPRNVYAATKLHQEHLSSVYAREAGASVVALRYHNVYGPRMPKDT